MSVRIIDRDKGWKALKRRARKLTRGRAVTVGVHSAEGGAAHEGDGGLSVADVATVNEFGLGNVPERSFIRAWVDAERSKIEAKMAKAARDVVKHRVSPTDALDLLGLQLVADVQARIRAGISPANAPSTIASKGSSTPLIDKGQLVSSILHEVEA